MKMLKCESQIAKRPLAPGGNFAEREESPGSAEQRQPLTMAARERRESATETKLPVAILTTMYELNTKVIKIARN